jgi:hypothetical protein
LLYAARRDPHGVRLFLGSSAVEHSTVNRMVAGSNPARGATPFHAKARHATPLLSRLEIHDIPECTVPPIVVKELRRRTHRFHPPIMASSS